MEYRDFKGEKISLLGFGMLRPPIVNGKIDEDAWMKMAEYAIENGVNYFDTAYVYHGGKSETFLGRILNKYPREKYYLATKIYMTKKYLDDIEKVFQTQLERLQTDYIDYYLFHSVMSSNWEDFKASGLFKFLSSKKKEGRIRHIGFSFHDKPELLKEVINEYDWDFAQIQLNYMDWTLQNAKEQYNILKESSLPIIVMEPVRGGGLAILCEKSIEIFKKANPNVSIASWALRYAASFPEVVCVLSGMSNMEQLVDNISTFTNFNPISNSEKEIIQNSLDVYLRAGDIPCTGCQYCIECPKNIDIPTIFSIYNVYLRKKEIGDLDNGRTPDVDFSIRYRAIPNTRKPDHCVNCDFCVKACPQHLDIPNELGKVINLYKKLNTRRESMETKGAQKIEFVGISEEVLVNTELYKINNHSDYIELFRHGRHCLGSPIGEDRWVRFVLDKPLEKGKKYDFYFKVKTNKPMKRVFFFAEKLNLQIMDLQIPADEWVNSCITFTAENYADFLCITATDMPICGSVFYVKSLKVTEVL